MAIALASIELAARLAQGSLAAHVPAYYYRQYLRALVEPSELLVWAGKPAASEEIANSLGEKISYQLNSNGWRDQEFMPLTKPRNALVMGDSFSFGLGVKMADRFSERLEKSLPGVNVWNMGVMGYAPDQYLLLSQRWLLNLPWSFLVIQLSNNDLADLAEHEWKMVNSSSGIPAMLGAPESHSFVSDYSEAWNLLAYFFLSLGKPNIESGLTRMHFTLNEICGIASQKHIPVILLQATDWGEPQYGKEAASRYRADAREIAGKCGAAFVEAAPQELLPYPDLHWTSSAHAKVAELLLPFAKQAVGR